MAANKNKNYNNILISLDCLLDTRLGTLSRIDSAIVNLLLDDPSYHTRDQDVFTGVDREVYKTMYRKRDDVTLQHSMLTNIIPLLKHLVGKLKEQSVVRPFHDGGHLIINVYPYVLSKEIEETIGKALAVWMHGLASVSIVRYSPKELTPLHCKGSYSLMIMYDYEEWLEINAELFLRTQIPEVTLFVPAIYFTNKPTDEELKTLNGGKISPMKALELLAKGIVGLEIIDVMWFSILNKKYSGIKF